MSDIVNLEDARNRAFRRVHPTKRGKRYPAPPQVNDYTSPKPRTRKSPSRMLSAYTIYAAMSGGGTKKVLD